MTTDGLLSLLPSQQQLLARINHLAVLDSGLNFISGPVGAGKYTLATALLEQFDAGFEQAWLNCRPRMNDADCREELLHQLLSDAVFDANDAMEDILAQYSVPQGSRWLLVITHAERLSNQLLVELWGMVESCRRQQAGQFQISVLLFAEPEWVEQTASELIAITAHQQTILKIPPLPINEREQLAKILAKQHHQAIEIETLAPSLVKLDGWPGEIVALFEQSMTGSNDAPNEKTRNRVFPKGVGFAVLLLLSCTALIFGWSLSGPESNETPLAERQQAPAPFSDVQRRQVTGNTATPESKNQPEQLAGNWSKDQQPLPVKVNAPDDVSAETPDETNATVVNVDDATVEKLLATQQQNTPTTDETLANNNNPPEHTPVPEKTVKPETVSTEAPSEPVAAEPVAKPAEAKETNLYAAIKNVPKRHFALQLFVVSSERSLQRFIREHRLGEDNQFHYYSVMRSGHRRFIGFYGEYGSADQAHKAIASLPAALRQVKPWARTYGSILQELKNVER